MKMTLLLLFLSSCTSFNAGAAWSDGVWGEVAAFERSGHFGSRLEAGAGDDGARVALAGVARVKVGPVYPEATFGGAWYPDVSTPFEPESEFRLSVPWGRVRFFAGVRHGWGNGARHEDTSEHAGSSGEWLPVLGVGWDF